ncbi:hypothetical protein DM02DRAFT_142335 [Periconia macrospinosa]|uniref:C2H2-type domain-containing protein n=1 Tax=Periconia macrospinosa TaxID=97972 RepID=A0A2V1E535_9PLEO|nr:hypothetical protein DM02DRAFT_142335 [Periconia macrospinosa]
MWADRAPSTTLLDGTLQSSQFSSTVTNYPRKEFEAFLFLSSSHQSMLNLFHTDASSTTHAETAVPSPFRYAPSSRIAPDSASTGGPDGEVLLGFHGATEETEAAGLLLGSLPNEDAFTSIEDLRWDDEQQSVTSSNEIWRLVPLSLDTSLLDRTPASSTFNNWPQDWPHEIGAADENVFTQHDHLQLQQRSFTFPIWTDSCSDNDFSNVPYESRSSTYSADVATPSSPQFTISVFENGRSRRDSNSSRMSRPASQVSSQSSASEPLKRRINPLKQHKGMLRDSSDNFPCDICGRPFRYKKDLERHRFSIHDRRPSWFCPAQSCRFATQGFSRKDKAFQHVKTHRSNSDASLKPIFDAERASLKSIGSAPVSPRLSSGHHRFPTPLREREEQDIDTLS